MEAIIGVHVEALCGKEAREVAAADPRRPIAKFQPSLWGDYFVTHSPPPNPPKMSEAQIRERIVQLLGEVKVLLRDAKDMVQQMQLINDLQRLGVAYHFEEEIGVILSRINDVDIVGDENIHVVSLRFRLLRQNGYNAPSDVFNRFKDEDGKFKADLANDGEGLLSLYEAAYLGTLGEAILDEAISYTRTNLRRLMVDRLEPPLATLVSQALETPLIRRMNRLEAKHYISIYQDCNDTIRNDAVLELAKLDYHLLQGLYWEEVRSICMWMNESGLLEKLPFVRDRVVELYFWMLGVGFEPGYSRTRIIMTKVAIMVSFVDDFYDSYGLLEELGPYYDAVKRWDVKAVDTLPEVMKDQFLTMINMYKEFEDELALEDKYYHIYYLKEAMKALVKVYYDEAKWREEGYVATVEDHISVSIISCAYPFLSCASFVGMGDVATKEAFDWILKVPKIVEAASGICRFMDDINSHEFEQERAHVASLVECFVRHEGISVEAAHAKLRKMVEDCWKVINEECLRPDAAFPMPLLTPIVNLARMMEVFHKNGDGYTHGKFVKGTIAFVLVKPVLI